jgi:hypothetical protein
VGGSYHNTTNAGAELARYERAARSQDEQVAELFRSYVSPFSPSEAHRMLRTRAPLTSIRRAITNLTRAGVLERTDEQAMGPYGRPEYRWKLARGEPQQGLLL